MAKQLRYSGEFLSLSGSVWRCDILQEAASAYPSVGELTFPAEDPLTIEWDERAPGEPVCGSMATLRIESPGDRTYVDLYTDKPTDIRLDVYLDDALYWSGCLDTETYREPYDRGSKYDVELTFYDFGHLGRIPYGLTGTQTLDALLTAALSAAGLGYASVFATYLSTKFTDDTLVTLGALSIPSENFYDEDGIALDWEKVLEGILQPLALRIVQHAGRIWVYDINALYRNKLTVEPVVWSATGQELSTSRVYNDIRVTFSPYSKGRLSPEFKYGDLFGPQYINLNPQGTTPDYYSFYKIFPEGSSSVIDPNYVGFTIFRSADGNKCKGLAEIGTNNRYFKIYPMLGGDESEGVAVGFVAGAENIDVGTTYLKGIAPGSHPQTLALRTRRLYLPDLAAADREDNFVRIAMDMLADPRYNPFEDADLGRGINVNEAWNYDLFKSWAQQAFVPVSIVLYDASGTALYHYHNAGITSHGHPADSVLACASWASVGDGWQSGEASFGDAWLAYYAKDLDLVYGKGCLGWLANRQNFGKPWAEGNQASSRKVYYSNESGVKTEWSSLASFAELPDGQFIPYPPVGGYLEIRVYNGVYIFDDTDRFAADGSGGAAGAGLYSKLRWLLYKAPEVSVVKRTLTYDASEIDDIEYSGVANTDAREDLDIDTICGTAPSACPTAKGIYLRSSTGQQVSQFKRQGRTESAEQLLIGTLYSQYAARKTVLSGETDIYTGTLTLFEDAAQEAGTKFLITGEEQHMRLDTSDVTLLEVRPDEYTAE